MSNVFENKGAMAATVVVAASDSLNKAAANFVCSGANDEVEIQAAIDALPAGGGDIKLLEGTYHIAAVITVPDYTVIKGCHIPTWGMGTILELDYDGTMFELLGTNRLTDRVQGCGLYNLLIDGNSRAGRRAIDAKYCHNFTITDCTFYQCIPAIYAEECWDWALYNVNFNYCGDVTNPQVTAYNGADDNCNWWKFINCRWEPMTGIGFFSDNTGDGSDNHQFSFSHCKFHGVLGEDPSQGLSAMSGCLKGCRIFGNTFFYGEGTANAIGMLDGSNVIIVCNHFSDYADYAIELEGGDHMIEANRFINSGVAAFVHHIDAGGTSILTGNVARTPADLIDNAHGTDVEANNIELV